MEGVITGIFSMIIGVSCYWFHDHKNRVIFPKFSMIGVLSIFILQSVNFFTKGYFEILAVFIMTIGSFVFIYLIDEKYKDRLETWKKIMKMK